MLLAIVSDTHMPRGSRRLPAGCTERLLASNLILHAGDFCAAAVLREIEGLKPVAGVQGNMDDAELRALLPGERIVLAGGTRIGMVHDAGPARGRLERMRRRFPEADAVVYGHSHLPLHERAHDGFQLFNPGSPTERRRASRHTMGMARVDDGAVEFELVDLDGD